MRGDDDSDSNRLTSVSKKLMPSNNF
jgi:hypothetical protein